MYRTDDDGGVMIEGEGAGPLAPAVKVPPGVRVFVHRWDQWWECGWKGETLCLPDHKGIVTRSDPVYVEGRTLKADQFAGRLRQMGFRFVGVGDPEDRE